MRIIDSDGKLQCYTKDIDGEKMMRAVQGNFGLFGIIWDITFDVSSLIIVESSNIWERMQRVIYEKDYLKNTIENNSSVQLFWTPFNSMKTYETFEATFDGDVDSDEWEPNDDEIFIKLVNPVRQGGEVNESPLYKLNKFKDWAEMKVFQLADKAADVGKNQLLTPLFCKNLCASIKVNKYITIPHESQHLCIIITEWVHLWTAEYLSDCHSLMPQSHLHVRIT